MTNSNANLFSLWEFEGEVNEVGSPIRNNQDSDEEILFTANYQMEFDSPKEDISPPKTWDSFPSIEEGSDFIG